MFRLLRSRPIRSFVPTAVRCRPTTSIGKRWSSSSSAACQSICPPLPDARVDRWYGCNKFDENAMRSALPEPVFEKYQSAIRDNRRPDTATADAIAHALLNWSLARGATSYAHWFQPIGRSVAERHDTFLSLDKFGRPTTRFTAKELLQTETDGSSFANGGLRSTDAARGYLAFDPSSHPFVRNHGNGATLLLPSVFLSWTGQALDYKAVLLRSEAAFRTHALDLFKAIGDTSVTTVHAESGLEQEFFLIDKKYYDQRPDLQQTGRTLIGATASKGQKAEDQYFAGQSDRMLNCLQEVQNECWKLGIPVMTRHREVAPGQYELAPRFAKSSLATDNNLVLMDVLKKVALKHGLVALLHPKPFEGLNGSGKHNNWSFGTNTIPSLLDPGPSPATNTKFMFFLAAVLRAVDLHADLLRWSVSGAANDLRLGGNEAPPAIMSVYLGAELYADVQSFIDGKLTGKSAAERIDTGIPGMPTLDRAPVDRNRTSPIAHTGNKMEFRAVASNQNPSISNMVWNTIMADSFRYFAGRIRDGRTIPDLAMAKIAREMLQKHSRIVFNGDGYSKEWIAEAAKRGLSNLQTTPDCLDILTTPETVRLFESLAVLSKEELSARRQIGRHEYCQTVLTESRVLLRMIGTQVLPAADYAGRHPTDDLRISLQIGLDNLQNVLQEIENHKIDDPAEVRRRVLPVMLQLRQDAADVELRCPADKWPLSSYDQMLNDQD